MAKVSNCTMQLDIDISQLITSVRSSMPSTRYVIRDQFIPLSLASLPSFQKLNDGYFVAACVLQSCLNKNTYAPEKCDLYMRDLYKCCADMYDSINDKGESTACPIPRVVRRWIQNYREK